MRDLNLQISYVDLQISYLDLQMSYLDLQISDLDLQTFDLDLQKSAFLKTPVCKTLVSLVLKHCKLNEITTRA